MTRLLALTCSACRRKFGGQQTLDRHQYIAGDAYRCRADAELTSRGFYRDGWGVWHRGANPDQRSLLGLSEAVTPTPARVLSRASDPSTSHRAAASVAPRTGTYKRLLFDAIAASEDGLTFEEAARRVGMDPWQASKRVSDLKRDGLVVVIGERPGASGKAQEVCRVAERATA
jgi:hypothetical protein